MPHLVPSAKRIWILVIGAVRSTSKLPDGAAAGPELVAVDVEAAAADCVIGGTGLPKRFPEPAKGPGGGAT